MVQSYYKSDYRNTPPSKALPVISSQLDSVRVYQFEVHFEFGDQVPTGGLKDLTLAAKVVGTTGISVEDIEVRRVHDPVYFPGAPKNEELNITFDSQYVNKTSAVLWEWFRSIYDPLSGNMTKYGSPGNGAGKQFKAKKLTVIELDNDRNPHAAMEFYGVYPKAVKFSEKNYTQNEFATIEVTFRYDYMDYYNYN
jgi:hypothetical protein